MSTRFTQTSFAACTLAIALAPLSVAFANPTPSTNDANRANGWAHVNIEDVGTGYAELEFVSTRAFASCFEYRSDGDTSQVLAENGGNNYNNLIDDGLYPYYCVNNSTRTETIQAAEYIEVRMVFGAESDERFDWTRVDVDPVAYSCAGFNAPADRPIVVKKPNRVLPLRMTLLDADGAIVYDIAPPVLSAAYQAEPGDTPADAGELDYAGRGDDGNMFMFDGTGWVFNLSTKGLAPGEYMISAVPGGAYAIDPDCKVVVTIQ